MKLIDINTWDRKTHYEFFKRMDYPQYNICTNIDITRFLPAVKQKQLPFYYAMIYAATYVLNNMEAFRYRSRNQQVVLHDKVHPSFTAMSPTSDLFKLVVTPLEGLPETFAQNAKKQAAAQTQFITKEAVGRDDVIYITCVPWVTFTHISHTISLNKDDSIPRISWGKYFPGGDKILLPFSVQAHHSFVDGIHIGRYIDSLQKYLDNSK
ncbi:MAG: chloramphenicol acetyltransferase [Firmicutes bacterium]|nr:chloramphenicol acetyltransferase [Bacillota bacterium]